MNVLITGGFGYLGGRVAQFLATLPGYNVQLGSRKRQEPPKWLPDANIIQTLWRSQTELEKICTDIDVIVHLAGMNAHECTVDPVAAIEFNAVCTARLLQAAIKKDVKRFIYISTAHVYGSPLIGDIDENTCPIGLHPYATSHRAGEDVILAAHQCREIEGIVIRLSNAYGAPTHQDANCWMLLINDLCRQAVTSQQLVLNSSGNQRRDFIAIRDVCLAIRHLLELPATRLDNGLFNVGGARTPTILEMTKHVAELFYIATTNKLEIKCKTDQTNEHSVGFNYGMKKLCDTGFKSSDKSIIDQEINGLIQFCFNHFSSL